MKSTTLALLGGLLCAGSALASDPVPPPQPTAAGSSMKTAIDPTTGKRRALTAAESAALDAAAPATSAMSRSAVQRRQRIPATEAEAAATAVTANGITMMKPSQEMLSTITISRDADGKVVYSEDGVPMGQQQEAAHE